VTGGAWRRGLAYYGSHLVVSAALLAVLVPFGEWPLQIPFNYSGDGLLCTALVKGIAEEGPVRLTRIGAPFGSNIADWPNGMWLPFGITSLLYRATGSAGTSINLHWLLAIVATGLFALWSLRRLGVAQGESFVGALLYAFLPYVFYRNVTHFFEVYPFVPPVALLCLRVVGLRPQEASRSERWVTLGACLAQGLAFAYYAFFGCVLLAFAAAIGWWRSRRRDTLRLGAAGILLLTIGTAIPLLPSAAYWIRHGRNPQLAYKNVAEADAYGLKIRHLLTPISEHPVGLFRDVAARVALASFPGENENTTAKLGFLGSVGFLALLATALGAAAGARAMDERLGPPAALTLVALLVAQVGGFGSLFNLFVAPDIRAYNRIVVFIAFFSLYATTCLLERVSARLTPARRGALWSAALLVAVAGFGVVDQVPVDTLASIRNSTARQFAEDQQFVGLVERLLPPGAMVFQLPVTPFPVDPGRAQMGYYEHARAYLQSEHLRWSWGAIDGRGNEWQLSVAKLPPVAMARRLTLAGFSGIWIDRRGYGPRDLSSEALEKALVETSRSPLWTSSTGRYAFLVLNDLRRRLEAGFDPERYREARAEALRELLHLLWREGCSDERMDTAEPSRWCTSSAWGILKNDSPQDQRFVLSGRLRAARPGRATIAGPGFRDDMEVADAPVPYTREISIPAARRLRIELSFEGRCLEEPERRCLELIDLKATALGQERGPRNTAGPRPP